MYKWPGRVRSWSSSTDGVTAVEFSLVAWPFILLICGIFELSLMFLSDSMLNGAVNDAARVIRTGQVQQTSGGSNQLALFKKALCSNAGVFLNCNNFQYQVQNITSFSSANMATPATDKNGKLLSQPFSPGSASDVVLIRVIYLYPLLTPFIGIFFADEPGNHKMLQATTVIQTEPYVTGT